MCRAPASVAFPYTTLFRSRGEDQVLVGHREGGERDRVGDGSLDRGFGRDVRIRGATPVVLEDDHLDAARVEAAREARSEEHTSELQSRLHLVCRLLLEKKK